MRSARILRASAMPIATMKALGATGGNVFAVYCTQMLLVALFAAAIGAATRSGVTLCRELGVRRHHTVAGRAGGASASAGAGDSLRTADGIGFRTVAARAGPRYFGVDAVSRPGRRRTALAAPALYRRHRGDCRGACSARDPDHLRPPHCRDLRRVRYRGISCCCGWSRWSRSGLRADCRASARRPCGWPSATFIAPAR